MSVLLFLLIIGCFIFFVSLLFIFLKERDRVKDALSLWEKGHLSEAEDILKSIIRTNPRHFFANYHLAKIYDESEDYERALEHYIELNKIGKFNGDKLFIEINKRIAMIYYASDRLEMAFESYLDVIRVDPNDKDANSHLGFMAVGQGEFQIGESYLEKAIKADPKNHKSKIALAICQYENGEASKAVKTMEPLIGKADKNEVLEMKVLFVLLCQKSDQEKGLEIAKKMLPEVTDENIKLLLLRIMIVFIGEGVVTREKILFIYNYLQNTKISPEISYEIQYFVMILALQIEDFDLAKSISEKIFNFKKDYKDLIEFLIFIDHEDLNPPVEEYTPYMTLVERNFDSLIPPELLFKISGLATDSTIDFNRFYKTREEGKIELHPEYGLIDGELASREFQKLKEKKLLRFCKYVIEQLGYKILNHQAVTEEGTQSFVIQLEEDKKIEAFISFQQFSEQASVSEIHFNNFFDKLKSLRVENGILVTNARLTSGANKKIEKESNIKSVSRDQLGRWLSGFALMERASGMQEES